MLLIKKNCQPSITPLNAEGKKFVTLTTEEMTLLSAPKIVPKKTAGELAAEAVVAGPKEKVTGEWKWKQKDVTDLVTMSENFLQS